MAIKILCFSSYYLPSYKAGGPVKTIRNMVDHLLEFEFSIVTRDRDLGDAAPFTDVRVDRWKQVGRARVIYLSPGNLSLFNVFRIISNADYDVLYLNSFFDFHFTIKALLVGKLSNKKYSVVLAPRGEFSKGALALKSFKKKFYIKLFSWLGLSKGIVWQASSEFERKDIMDALSVSPESVFVARDLPEIMPEFKRPFVNKACDDLRIIFLSRISPMKNLDFALRALMFVKNVVVFDIYGPKEDPVYWESCLELIDTLPANIIVNYCGSVEPVQVSSVFAKYDLFFFPTRGENYGHVIAESLSVGTPVLISDQTPWKMLESDHLGWDLPLGSAKLFIDKIEALANLSPEERSAYREKVQENGLKRVNCENDIADNKRLFEFAIQRIDEDKA